MNEIVRALGAAALTAAVALTAWAQTYPTRPVHLVVAYAAGGTGDIVARLISDRLAAALGQTVVVENRAGASGAIGAQSVVSAATDGHTLLLGQPAEVAINQHWIKGLAYDPDKDLQAVALVRIVGWRWIPAFCLQRSPLRGDAGCRCRSRRRTRAIGSCGQTP